MRWESGSLSPEAYAQDLRHRLSLGWGPIEPEGICGELGIRFVEEDMGASGNEAGALVSGRSGRLAIVVNRNLRYESRRRFTIAHELGHACIPAHARETWCLADDIENYMSRRNIERQANAFAAELLLPERVIKERLRKSGPSLGLARALADEFGASLTATTCRVVSLAPRHDLCAVALSDSTGTIRWILPSPGLRLSAQVRSRGEKVSTYSVAADVLAGKPVPSEAEWMTPATWFREWPSTTEAIREEAAPYARLGLVLSFIEILVEDDEDTDEVPN